MTDLLPQDPVGIGGYRLLRRLGAGGMGRVYLGRSSGGRTVAVKLVKSELAADPAFRTRFRMEVEAARRVGARWTAPVLDADTEADTPWVATGYIAGPGLDQVVSAGAQGGSAEPARQGHGPLPPGSVRVLAYGLASALLDIHGVGIVHRDLKPSNVLLTIDGPRVIDFGIARALDEVPESTLTSTGMVVGSPSFMSPEQITGGRLSPAGDVFCLGAVLAYAATGRPPFGPSGGAGGVHAVMFRIASEEPDLAGLGEDGGPDGGPAGDGARLRELIADCLAKDPADRPAPEEVVSRVQPVAVGASEPPWLPAGLLAELGREAVRLLDTDTPPSGSDRHGGGAQDPAPLSGPEGPDAGAPGPGTEPVTGTDAVTRPAAAGERAAEPATSALSQPGRTDEDAPPRRVRRGRRVLLAAAAALVLAGAGIAAAGAGLGSSDSGGRGNSDRAASAVPDAYLGTWVGPVERDGEPNGQHRRFHITQGQEGEVVANSISLGTDYECKSDGKLAKAPSSQGDADGGGKTGMRLDTRVVKSVPEGRCSAIGVHTLKAAPDGTLRWRAAGRTATLHKVATPERVPEALVGEWRRPLSDGGTQTLSIGAGDSEDRGLGMVSDGSEHCEARVDLFAMGDERGPTRIGPPDVDRSASRGTCEAGDSSTLRVEGGSLIREFPGGAILRYQRQG
ncbi:serine/threonine-protein kinase [Streptomyces reniochalinae]|uniref:Serine/threonine protein kinase n=1 Tax=Streptomyces reniochalinae TaxID=2250578 RepID=A0A367F2V3_9ACTN|nr:serine/threonine-protein kinase [Streptomyces reniochalinae]RCG24125.1 serine/threonine protein kinase [Streptomyces reniochalinae]